MRHNIIVNSYYFRQTAASTGLIDLRDRYFETPISQPNCTCSPIWHIKALKGWSYWPAYSSTHVYAVQLALLLPTLKSVWRSLYLPNEVGDLPEDVYRR